MLQFRFSRALKEFCKPNLTRLWKASKVTDNNVTAATAAGGCASSYRRSLCTQTDAVNEKKAGILPSLEDLLFYTIAEGQEKIPAHKFTTALKATGLRTGDPRLKECMEMLKVTLKTTSDGALDRHLFKKCVQSNIVLLTQAFRKKFVIPDFQSFTSHIDQIYESAKSLSGGQVADYIPQLAKFSPNLWAVALCTVDGQRYTAGDTKVPFCLQSCVKPLKYAVAVHDHGTEYVHRFIGKEPSGLRFNKLFLDEDDKPHNPMVNAGAIVCTSLLKVNHISHLYILLLFNKMGVQYFLVVGRFQSERLSGDRNFAIGYYLKEKKCFPEGTDMISILDLYLQVKSVINLLFAAYTGDVSALRRFALSSMDMEQRDYDSRTALHVAAAEGHTEVVRFLLEACKVNPVPKDRWGNTPMDEAIHFGHHDVVTILQDYHNTYSPKETTTNSDKETAEKNLDGML
uniref:glutaminase n=1 Tax=Cyprinus carpio TaxID=7962 RepID=A0A8C2L1W9_CYPCA